MGMIANYQYISDKDLMELKELNGQEDEIFEKVEQLNEDAEILLDIDKMWDVLHFVLTGISTDEPIEDNPLSEAVVGVSSIDDISDFIAYTEKEKVAEIISALEKFDMEKAMKNFKLQECKNADLYPDIWDDEEEIEELKEEISDYFENMKDFYKQILEINGNVLVTIY